MISKYIEDELDLLDDYKEEEQIQAIVDRVKEKFETKCDYFYAGGFDSPGYDIDCYVIVFIDADGEIQGIEVTSESY